MLHRCLPYSPPVWLAWASLFLQMWVGWVVVCMESLPHPPPFDPSSYGRMSRWPGSGVATKWRGAAVHWLWSTC